MRTATLTFGPDGVGHCFHTDAIRLQEIGTLVVSRATTIEFNGAKQLWQVVNNDGHILYEHSSRQACIQWEQIEFNAA